MSKSVPTLKWFLTLRPHGTHFSVFSLLKNQNMASGNQIFHGKSAVQGVRTPLEPNTFVTPSDLPIASEILDLFEQSNVGDGISLYDLKQVATKSGLHLPGLALSKVGHVDTLPRKRRSLKDGVQDSQHDKYAPQFAINGVRAPAASVRSLTKLGDNEAKGLGSKLNPQSDVDQMWSMPRQPRKPRGDFLVDNMLGERELSSKLSPSALTYLEEAVTRGSAVPSMLGERELRQLSPSALAYLKEAVTRGSAVPSSNSSRSALGSEEVGRVSERSRVNDYELEERSRSSQLIGAEDDQSLLRRGRSSREPRLGRQVKAREAQLDHRRERQPSRVAGQDGSRQNCDVGDASRQNFDEKEASDRSHRNGSYQRYDASYASSDDEPDRHTVRTPEGKAISQVALVQASQQVVGPAVSQPWYGLPMGEEDNALLTSALGENALRIKKLDLMPVDISLEGRRESKKTLVRDMASLPAWSGTGSFANFFTDILEMVRGSDLHPNDFLAEMSSKIPISHRKNWVKSTAKKVNTWAAAFALVEEFRVIIVDLDGELNPNGEPSATMTQKENESVAHFFGRYTAALLRERKDRGFVKSEQSPVLVDMSKKMFPNEQTRQLMDTFFMTQPATFASFLTYWKRKDTLMLARSDHASAIITQVTRQPPAPPSVAQVGTVDKDDQDLASAMQKMRRDPTPKESPEEGKRIKYPCGCTVWTPKGGGKPRTKYCPEHWEDEKQFRQKLIGGRRKGN
jgi:hypothetical protein